MSRPITSQSVVAYAQCPRKAFFLMRGEPIGCQHEYEQVLAERAAANRSSYVAGLTNNELESSPKDTGSEFGIARIVCVGDLLRPAMR